MTTLPKISIITPSYNQGHFIEETITSVLDQNYPNLEYIIMDGGSKDDTVEVIKKYQRYITYWVSEKDKGQSDAINKGFRKATGDVINWLNSDDYYEPGTLLHVGEIFSDPDVMAYCGKSRIFSSDHERPSPGTDIYNDNLEKTIGWARIDQPETFFRKMALDESGYLNENLHFVMDKDLWVRFLCQFGIDNIRKDDRMLAHFRLHGESKTVSLQEEFDLETSSLYYTYALQYDLDRHASAMKELFGAKKLELEHFSNWLRKPQWEKILNYFFLYKGLHAYAMNDYKKAKAIFQFVKADGLDAKDKQELGKVKTRLRFLPKGIKKIWNSLK
jgi:glycosyltransferase involved in cell wall biosynthesis